MTAWPRSLFALRIVEDEVTQVVASLSGNPEFEALHRVKGLFQLSDIMEMTGLIKELKLN